MIFEFGQYKIDVDVEKTRRFYEKASAVTQNCGCNNCCNYAKAVDFLPETIGSFFTGLGIDKRKACEVYANCTNPDRTVLYSGFYHLCGKMLSGKSAWVKDDNKDAHWNNKLAYEVAKNFYVSFTEECALIENDFLHPVLQMEIYANIPWVLDVKIETDN